MPSTPARQFPGRAESGQATVEYLGVAMALLIALVAISVAGQERCVKDFGGELSAADCRNLPKAVAFELRRAVEDVTFLINLPF